VPFDENLLPGYPLGDPTAGLNNARPLPPREARTVLAGEPSQVKVARDFASAAVRSWRMPDLADGPIRELTSELATNVVLHANTDFTVVVRYNGARVRVEVGDGSRAAPVQRSSRPQDTSGRGLMMVDAMASDWGVTDTLHGKRVWFELPASE
jgi:anti-sigma regulatory factor (Ser/Thr protein kinase)